MFSFCRFNATFDGMPVSCSINPSKICWIEDKSSSYCLHMNNGERLELSESEYMKFKAFVADIVEF